MKDDFFSKLFWSLAPLAWGMLSWGVWRINILSIPLKLAFLASIAFIATNYFFGKILNHASQRRLKFLNVEFQLPQWQIFFIPIFIGIIAFFIWPSLLDNQIIWSLVQGILLYSIAEELITRSFLIKYTIEKSEFLWLNILSSLSFSLMHWFYGETILQTLTVGHFPFCFALNIIAYKTQRIELTIILHIISNFLSQILGTLILGGDFSHPISGFAYLIFNTIFYAAIAGYLTPTQTKT